MARGRRTGSKCTFWSGAETARARTVTEGGSRKVHGTELSRKSVSPSQASWAGAAAIWRRDRSGWLDDGTQALLLRDWRVTIQAPSASGVGALETEPSQEPEGVLCAPGRRAPRVRTQGSHWTGPSLLLPRSPHVHQPQPSGDVWKIGSDRRSASLPRPLLTDRVPR